MFDLLIGWPVLAEGCTSDRIGSASAPESTASVPVKSQHVVLDLNVLRRIQRKSECELAKRNRQ